MGNDIEIRVRVANNTATGLTAVNNSLNRLRDEARDAGQSLTALTTRAAAASVALHSLKDAAQGAARALRSLNTAARNADGRLDTMSQRSRTLRRDTDDLDVSMRSLAGTLGGIRGRIGTLNTSSGSLSGGMDQLKKTALLLSPALIPVAAAAVPIATSMAAAGVAVGAFGLAIGGQVAALSKASEAEKKYNEAVKEHGRTSEEAAKAENAYLRTVKDMDPATRRAATAFSVFKEQYKSWSNSLAKDTMPVVTKGFATFGAVLPRLTPLVRATSSELDRLMTVLAGGVNSSGFDRFMGSFAEFASGALSKATDGLVRFMRTMSGGAGSSQFTEFMAYVREVGPQVGETLGNLARALTHMVAAASETGAGILQVVNAFARLVSAIPTGVLSTLLQFVVVFKAVKIAALALGGAGGAITGFGVQLAAMRAASVAAGGGLTGLAAGFGALSRAAKVALIGSGIGILVVALSELSEVGKAAPPDIDKLSGAFGRLGKTGQATGEAARVFGRDLEELHGKVSALTDPSNAEKVQQWIVTLGGLASWDSTPVKEAKEQIDSIDKALAGIVKGGRADLAAAALKKLAEEYGKGGRDTGKFTKEMDDYKEALADARFEAELNAATMGLFGQQALAVSDKLAAQKASADGLRQSLQALNDVQRQGLGGMIGFEAAIDAAGKAAQENAGALSMTRGQLDLNSEKARNAASALNDLAAKTEEAAASARQSGSSWETVNGVYQRGRSELVKSARAMGLTKEQAAQLAGQILKIPNKTTRIKMDKEDAQKGLEAFNSAVKRSPGSKSVTLKTLSKGAEQILESFGLKVKRLPNGSVKVVAATGGALSGIKNVQGALNSLRDRSVTVTTYSKYVNVGGPSSVPGHRFLKQAEGGLLEFFANGGTRERHVAQIAPAGAMRVWAEPETGGEAYIPLAASKRPRSRQIAAETVERLGGEVEWFAKGGLTKRQKALKERAKAEREERNQARGELTISHFGWRAGRRSTEFANQLGSPGALNDLVGTLNKWRGIIKRATHEGVERRLLRSLDRSGRSLISHEKKLLSVNKALDKAKDKLTDLKSAASQLRGSVKSGIISGANITKAAGAEDSRVTINTLLSQMSGSAANSKQFAGMLKSLKKRGLDKGLIEEIAQSGVEGGGMETAAAILGGGSAEIKQLNKFRYGIVGAAKSAGNTAADAMYGAGIKAAEGLVKGLQKKQDAIEKQMMRIAKSMEKAIKRALGIRSPSKVMEQVGDFTAEGFAVGMRKNRAVTPAWQSMLNQPRAALPAPAGRAPVNGRGSAGWGDRPLMIQVQIGNGQLGEIIIDPLRKAVSTRGGLRATFGGLD